jgi:hypothetical protein
VNFKEGVPDEKARALIAQQGATVIEIVGTPPIYHIQLKKDQSVKEALEAFLALPEVELAEPNYSIRIK